MITPQEFHRHLGSSDWPDNNEIQANSFSRNFVTTCGAVFVTQCWCGEDPDLSANGGEADASECDKECAGNTDEICGGSNRITVYSITAGKDPDYPYIGCYADQRSGRAMGATGVLSTESMTNDVGGIDLNRVSVLGARHWTKICRTSS